MRSLDPAGPWPVFAALLLVPQWVPAQDALPVGVHRMVLDCPGGELPFSLQLSTDGRGGVQAFLGNGSERIRVPEVQTRGELVLRFPHFDSELRLGSGTALEGVWIKRRGKHESTRIPVRRSPAPGRFCFSRPAIGSAPRDWCIGRFRVKFARSADPAVGVFRRVDGQDHDLEGTFLTTLGDYRFLAGNTYHRGFSLSCFDGAHAFLFRAEHQQADNSIRGEFWSSDTWHETWTGVRDDHAALPDGFGLTRCTEGVRLGGTILRDLTGKQRTLDDAALRGTVRLIDVFGSWCPNCHDHGSYLAELHRRYAAKGLRVIGVAFEQDDDFARSVRQVRAFAKRHRATFPMWIGGVADKKGATTALRLLDRVRAFPTTLFVDRRGVVRGVYQGWSGPAAKSENARLRQRFEQRIDELLAEK
ncbi:MAG: TlpA family protein disulfide reductase [Planctomycetes bacterium]|nr:TlpA family protein disulfide reductase [Planctomycetota bacterium]